MDKFENFVEKLNFKKLKKNPITYAPTQYN